MKLRITMLLAGLVLLPIALVACSGDDDDGGDATPSPGVTAQATQSGTVSTSQSPTVGVPAAGAYRVEEVFPAMNFERMLLMLQFPDDASHAAVVSQRGVIYRAPLEGDEEASVYLDVSDLLIDNPGNEEGLLGMAFAPDFETSREFYIYYQAGNPRRHVIARYDERTKDGGGGAGTVLLELEDPYANHNGGHLAFGPDDMLYVGIGDGGSGGDPQGRGQNTSDLFGSILRIDVSGDAYTSPEDNPFASGGGAPEVWAYGLRNPWRFSFDRATGDMWAGDVGQGAQEEVDRITRGGNYGWNIMEGDACYRADSCNQQGLILPRATYGRDDGISVTGGYVYRGRAMPELDGWYIYGDFGSGKVWAVDTRSEDSAPVLLVESEKNISSFAEDGEGEIYLVTFNNAVFRLGR